MSDIFGIFSCALSAAGNDIRYNGMKGLKSVGIFLVVASSIIAFSLSVLASTSSNFTKGDIPASYFGASQHNLVFNVTLPDGTNGAAEDTLLRDGSAETWSGYALNSFNSTTKFAGGSYTGSEAIVVDFNDNGFFNASEGDYAVVSSAPADGTAVSNAWGNIKFSGTALFDATSDVYDDTANAGIVDKRVDRVSSILFSNSGTATDIDIKLRVWNDTDSNGIFDRFIDKEIGPSSGITAVSSSQWNLSNGFEIPLGGQRIFVTVDTSTPTSGRTIRIGIPQNGVYVASNNDGPTDAAVTNAFTQTIDIITPSLTAVSITPPSPVRTNTLLNATCTDASALTVTYNIDSAANLSLSQTGGSFTATVDISSIQDGAHTINVFCSDPANNTATSGLSFTVDKTQPAVSITPLFSTAINNTAMTDNLSFSGSFSDSTTSIQSGDYSLDGGAPVSLPALNGSYGNDMNLNYSFTLSSVADGLHTVSVRTFDAPGNLGNASYGFFVDTEVPVSSVNPASAYKTSRVFQLPYSSNDSVQTSGIQNVTLYYRINQSNPYIAYANTTNGTFIFDATALGDGFYEFYTLARDNAGNVEAVPAAPDANTTIDTVMPIIANLAFVETPEYTNGTQAWFRQASHAALSFVSAVSDMTSGLQQCNATWDSSSDADDKLLVTNLTGNATFVGVNDDADATVNVTVSCTDKAGLDNRSSVIIMLDGTAPSISGLQWNETSSYAHVNFTGGLVYSSAMPAPITVSARGSSSDAGSGFRNANFSAVFGDGPDNSTSSSWEANYTINPSDSGNGTMNVTVFDNVGNPLSQLLNFAEDNAPPLITLSSPNGGELLRGGSVFTITWTPASDENGIATNNITIEYSTGSSWTLVASELPNSGSYLWAIPSIDSSSVTIRINASDAVQNVGSDSSNSVFAIDSAAPSILLAFTNDTDSDGKIDRIELNFSESVNVPSLSGVSIAGYSTEGTYSLTNIRDLSIYLQEASVDTNATPQITFLSSLIADLSGNLIQNQSITPQDKARPILLAARTNDTNLNGKIDVLMLNFSEPVNNIVANLISAADGFSISGYSNPSFISPSKVLANNTGVLNVTSTSTLMLQLGFTEGSSYDTGATATMNALAGYLADAAGNPLVAASSLAVLDGAPPFMANAATSDANGNGKIDNITITFTEGLQFDTINSGGGDFSLLPSYTILDVNKTGFAVGKLVLSLSEQTYFDGNETPIVSFVPGQTLKDSNGNNMTSGSVTPADGIRPVVTTTSGIGMLLGPGDHSFNATFSENVSGQSIYFGLPSVFSLISGTFNSSFWNGTIRLNSSVPDGTYTINITGASDTSGNRMLDNTSFSFTSDQTPPAITFLSQTPQNNDVRFENNTLINATITDASQISSVTVLWNSVLYNLSNSSGNYYANITSQPDGAYSFNITANDTLGNSRTTETRNITIFASYPRVTLIIPTPANGTYANSPVFIVNATAIGAGVAAAYINISGSSFWMTNTTAGVFNATVSLPDGTYMYNVTSLNASGGIINVSETRFITIDTIIPVINSVSVSSDRAGYFNQTGLNSYTVNNLLGQGGGQNLTFTVNATDSSPLNVSLTSGPQVIPSTGFPYIMTLQITPFYAGVINVSINVTDAAGNLNTTNITIGIDNGPPQINRITIDNTPPGITSFAGNTLFFGNITSAQFNISGNASDANGLGSLFSNSPYPNQTSFNSATGNWSILLSLNENSTSGIVAITVTDIVGNSANLSLTVTKDSNSPTAPVLSSLPQFVSSYPALSWASSTDTESGTRGYIVMRSADNATFINASSVLSNSTTNFTDTSSPEGLLFYMIKAIDNVNNTRSSNTVSTTVDFSAPAITSVNATKVNDIGTVVNITANITDTIGVNEVIINATVRNQTNIIFTTYMTKVLGTYNITWNTTNLTEGFYYIGINATDLFNRTTSVDKVLVILLRAPSTTLATPQSIFTNSSVTTVANTTSSVNTDVGLALDLITNSSSAGSINVLSYNTNPAGSTSGVTSLLALSKYFDIILSDSLNSTLSNATIRISYTDAELAAAGIDELSLKIYLWTGSTWQAQTSTVDAAGNTVSATVPHFSIYSTFGSAPPATPAAPSVSGGGGGGGGGGFAACLENWVCTDYLACSVYGTQKRTCVDKNRCGTIRGKPAESRSCTFTETPVCGNGIVETGEQCDTIDQACTSAEGYVGKKACSTTCNLGICIPLENCGDGICNGPETSLTCSSDCRPGQTGAGIPVTGQAISVVADPLLSTVIIAGIAAILFTAWNIRNRRKSAADKENKKKR